MRSFVLGLLFALTIVAGPAPVGICIAADPGPPPAGQITCPKCAKHYTIGLVRCPHCKHKQLVKCPNPDCTKPFTYGLQQCPHCESKIKYRLRPASRPGEQKPPEKKPDDTKPPEKKPDEPESKPAPKPASRPTSEAFQKAVKKLAEYYTDLYSKHLKSRDWFVRALAVVALARIEDRLTTEKILETLEKDISPLVKLYAWEALHARTKVLDEEQYSKWVKQGVLAATRGGFPGDFRAPLVKALGHEGPTPANVNFMIKLLGEVSHTDPIDSRTLTAMRETIAAWHDPRLVRMLIARMGKGGADANKAEYVLGGLESGVAPIGKVAAPTPLKEWANARRDWFKWINEAKPVAAKPGQPPRYDGQSKLIPAPGLIDPRDPKWREDLEIDKLRVSAFDLVFCVDSTSSMLPVMKWVGQEVIRMLGAFELVSREPRIGVTLFRHEIDPKCMHPCCKKVDPKQLYAMNVPDGKGGMKQVTFRTYRTKNFPLTGRVGDLAKWINAEKAAGAHHSHLPNGMKSAGASYGGLCSALTQQPWVKSKSAKKLIVILGDSPYTEGSEPLAIKAAMEAAKRGFIIHTVKVLWLDSALNPQMKKVASSQMFLPGFYKVAKAGGGKCMTAIFEDDRASLTAIPEGQIAEPQKGSKRFHTIVGEIIRSTIPEDYHKRVDPLVNVLLEYTSYPPRGARGR
jgi:hypothetical protein